MAADPHHDRNEDTPMPLCSSVLLDSLPVAVFEDRGGLRRFTPSRFSATAARPVDVWLTRGEVLAPLHSDDVRTLASALAKADEAGGSFVVRYRLRRSDGTYAWVEEQVSETVTGAEGEPRRFGLLFDVTSVQMTERLNEALVEQVPAGIRVYDTRAHRLTFTNAHYRELYGLSVKQVEGAEPMRWAERLHPDDRDRVVGGWRGAAERAEPWSDQYRWVRDSGQVLWIADREAPVDGMEHLRLGVAIDVTAQVTTQTRFEEMISHLPAAVGLLDTKRDEVIYVSDRVEELTGMPPCYWTRPGGRREVIRRAHPDDVPEEWGGPLLRGTRHAEFRWTRPDGEVRWFRNYATHLPGTDGVVQTVTFDITEERRARRDLLVQEERYQTLVENIPAATFVNTLDGYVRFVSPQIEQITGYTPEEWMTGGWHERVNRHYHADDHAHLDAAEAQLGRGDIDMYEREYRLRHKQGGWRTVLRRARRVTLSDGPAEVHGVIVDVSETREAQQRSREALASLITAAEAEQSRIASELHDDTVQVLVAALMRIRLAVARGASSEQLEAVADSLEQALDRARRLMFELRPEVLKAEGLGPALCELAAEGPWQRADVRVDVPRLSEETEALAYRTVRELVLNARKHSHASVLTIEGRIDGDRLVLTVADDGVGFDPTAAFNRREKRLHLGFATTLERVALAGGTLQVEANPGAGAEFTITLPADHASHEHASDDGRQTAA